MFDGNKSFLYKLRMYMFGQKYTKKEKFVMGLSFILMNAGYGIALPSIIEFINPKDINNATGREAFLLFIYLVSYMMIAYVIFLYIVRFLTEASIFLFRYIKRKIKDI